MTPTPKPLVILDATFVPPRRRALAPGEALPVISYPAFAIPFEWPYATAPDVAFPGITCVALEGGTFAHDDHPAYGELLGSAEGGSFTVLDRRDLVLMGLGADALGGLAETRGRNRYSLRHLHEVGALQSAAHAHEISATPVTVQSGTGATVQSSPGSTENDGPRAITGQTGVAVYEDSELAAAPADADRRSRHQYTRWWVRTNR